MKLPRLNLPYYEVKMRETPQGLDIWDTLRRRFVALTPEEWVRQHFVNYLINHLGYPQGLMGNEISLNLNGVRLRSDTIVYDRQGAPWMIIEYKAPDIPMTREVVAQALRYNLVLKARYITITNGLTIHCCAIGEDGAPQFLGALPSPPKGEQDTP